VASKIDRWSRKNESTFMRARTVAITCMHWYKVQGKLKVMAFCDLAVALTRYQRRDHLRSSPAVNMRPAALKTTTRHVLSWPICVKHSRHSCQNLSNGRIANGIRRPQPTSKLFSCSDDTIKMLELSLIRDDQYAQRDIGVHSALLTCSQLHF